MKSAFWALPQVYVEIAIARAWYTGQPIDEFDDRTACELVNTGEADKALRYIEMLNAGAAG